MTNEQIIKAWKNEEYRDSLSAEERAQLPENPIGEIDLTDSDLAKIGGGSSNQGPPVSGLLCLSVSVVTALWCVSGVTGGTCKKDTSGCC